MFDNSPMNRPRIRLTSMSPLLAAVLVVLLEALAFGAALPTLNQFVAKLNGTPAWAGVLFALVSGPKVIFNPLFGRQADRVGRRPMLIVATLGTLTSSVCWALAPTLWWLAVSRAINGVFGTQAGLTQAIAADVSAPEKRAHAVGMLGAAFGIAIAFGPLIGGTVAEKYGFWAVGWVCAAMQGLSLLIILTALRETRPAALLQATDRSPSPADETEIRLGHGKLSETVRSPLLARTEIAVLLAVVLFATIGQSELTSTLGDVAKRLFGYGPRETGHLFALFGVVALVVQGGIVRVAVKRVGELAVSLTGLMLMAAGFAFVATEPQLAGLYTAMVLIGAGAALCNPAQTALLSHTVPPDQQGEVMGLNQATLGVGRAAGNLSGGFLFQHQGTAAAYVCAAGSAIVGLVIQISQHGRLKRVGAMEGTSK